MRVSPWFLALSLTLAACDGESDTADTDLGTDSEVDSDADTDTDTELSADLAIGGTYSDDFGTSHAIDNEVWVQSSTVGLLPRRLGGGFSSAFNIAEFDNQAQFVLAQNDADNDYYPELYSRFDWSTNPDGALVYCQSTYDAATLELARAASADDSDMSGGCGGFSWSVLTPDR